MTCGEAARTLANKINWLIEKWWPAGLPPATGNADVAAVTQEVTHEYISRSTLWKLRSAGSPTGHCTP